MLEYKGYVGEVVYDDEAGVLHARVINSGSYPIANAEAPDAEGIRREFRISIDEYLASCKELGIEAVRPFSGDLRLRLGSELHRRATVAAMEAGVSLTLGLNRPRRDCNQRKKLAKDLRQDMEAEARAALDQGLLPLST